MPKKKIVKKEEVEKKPTNEIAVKINPKKYRITKHEHLLDNGKVYTDYRPQKKGWFFWSDIEEYHPDADTSFPVSFDTVEAAEQYLVDYIRLNGYMGETIIYPSADLDATLL